MTRRPPQSIAAPAPILGDGPLKRAAEIMGLDEKTMKASLAALMGRSFPGPDETTGLFDLDAIVRWRQMRNAPLYGLSEVANARDARGLVAKRLEARREALSGA